jgi:hypothetical protein
MQNEMRFTGAGCAALSDAVARAMMLPGGLTVNNLRGPGFRTMQQHVDADGFRALAPLPENSQKIIDDAVVEVGEDRLTLMADVMAAGLTYTLTDPLSITQLEWTASNKVGNARRVMSPESKTENFQRDILPHRLPIYLTIAGFELDIRTLRMSQRVGLPLDTADTKSATRAVNEAMEDAFINGATTLDGQALAVNGYSAPGIVNATNAETQALTAASWDASPVGATIFAEVQAMIAKLVVNKKFGPYRLYINTTVGAYLDSDYDTTSGSRGLTIRERLLKIPNLQAIRTADFMPAAKAVLVQMTSDVLDVVVGQSPTVIPWTSLSGMTFHNLVMAIMVPRVKWDYNNKSGICVGTIA